MPAASGATPLPSPACGGRDANPRPYRSGRPVGRSNRAGAPRCNMQRRKRAGRQASARCPGVLVLPASRRPSRQSHAGAVAGCRYSLDFLHNLHKANADTAPTFRHWSERLKSVTTNVVRKFTPRNLPCGLMVSFSDVVGVCCGVVQCGVLFCGSRWFSLLSRVVVTCVVLPSCSQPTPTPQHDDSIRQRLRSAPATSSKAQSHIAILDRNWPPFPHTPRSRYIQSVSKHTTFVHADVIEPNLTT